jgi:MFS family permease
MTASTADMSRATARRIIAPLALAQFICSFAGSNMNVMINDMSRDLDTTVEGIQISITLFLLTMAALMIPAGKLTDKIGRKRCFMLGLAIYGVGALVSAAAPGLWALILGNSLLEGIGTALLIPPVYILTTVYLSDIATRAWAFGIISGLGGIGAAAGPLIGGLITTAISWRAAFLFQALVIVIILLLSRRLTDPIAPQPDRQFDTVGAILSALGLFVLVSGILAADSSVPLMVTLVLAGIVILVLFFVWVRRREHAGKEPLLSTALFRNRVSNVALITQNLQWVLLMGTSFTVSAYLQVVRGYNAIETGVIFTAATVGLLLTSLLAGRLAKRFSQRSLIITGFVLCVPGVVLLIWLVAGSSTGWSFVPGLFLIGSGLGLMLTPSVNVVQSAFPEKAQGEISGLSRSASNLGSTLGTAIAGTILVANIDAGGAAYGSAMGVLAALGVGGLIASLFIPRKTSPEPALAE